MATTVTLNGTNYSIPAVGEGNWGTNVSNYLIALGSGVLQKAGGSFTLTADVDFGATYGLKAVKFSSRNTPSTAGVVRLGNDESIGWRDSGNSANLELKVNSSDVLEFDGNPLVTLALGAADTVLKMNAGGTAYEFGKLANANIATGAAIDAAKIHDASVSNTEFGYLNGVTSAIQTQLDAKIDDFSSSNDNRIVRTDGTSGDAIQESAATIDDSGNISGLNNITLAGVIDMSSAAAMTIGGTNATTINIGQTGQKTVIKGDLQVDGTTSTVNSETLEVTDANITVNNTGNQASADGSAGITVEMSDATDVVLIYDSTLTARFKIGDTGSEHEIVTTGHAQTITALKTIDTELLLKQISTPSNPASGYNKIYPKSDDKLYYLNSAGLEQEIGSGSGSGQINFLEGGDFEDGTVGGFATYDDGASATPVDGDPSGGSAPNLTLSADATTVLNGTYSLKIAKGAADAQGEGASASITIPKGYRNTNNVIRFLFATDGAYASGDCAVFLYDVDTSTLITPRVSEIVGYDKDNPGAIKQVTDFSIADTTSENYRLIFHVTSTNASAWDLYVDDILVGPEDIVQGGLDTEWEPFTPTISGNNTAPTQGTATVQAWYKKVADSIDIKYTYIQTAAGNAGTSTIYRFPIPDGLTIDTSKIPTDFGTSNVAGQGYVSSTTVTGTPVLAVVATDTELSLWNETNGYVDAGFAPLSDASVIYSFEVKGLPIAEWAGSTQGYLGANDVEYMSNSDTSTTISDTTSFQYGASGASIVSVSSANAIVSKRVQSQVASQNLDEWRLLVSPGNNVWLNAADVFPFQDTGTAIYGMRATGVSSTQIDVEFGGDGATEQDAWSSYTSWSWKVVKNRSGIPVAFGEASKDYRGLSPKGVFKIGEDNAINLQPRSTTPSDPDTSSDGKIYIKGGLVVFQYNDAGTVRYKYLDLTGTGVTWVHTTTAP